MTLPDPAPPRKRRGPGLIFAIAILLAAAWSGGWFWLKGQAIARMDQTAKELSDEGYRLEWSRREVSGFPFRLDIDLTDLRMSEPSGWALTAPLIKGEAYIYAIHHWVLVAPQGVTFTRPDGGAVIVQGKALRASISEVDKRLPRVDLEGYELTFSPEAGAKPYFLSSAKQLNARLLSGPDDQGAFLLRVGGAKMALQGLAARATEGGVVDMDLGVTLKRISAFEGENWADAARAWAAAGGVIGVDQASVSGGAVRLSAKAGTLKPAANGRLEGSLDASLGDLTGTGQSLQGQVVLRNGKAYLGPLEVGPAPRLW